MIYCFLYFTGDKEFALWLQDLDNSIIAQHSRPGPWLSSGLKEAKRSSSLAPSTIEAPRFH
jgi:hypothetical protein